MTILTLKTQPGILRELYVPFLNKNQVSLENIPKISITIYKLG